MPLKIFMKIEYPFLNLNNVLNMLYVIIFKYNIKKK